MFKDCSKKDGEGNAGNPTTGPKDKLMDQTKDKGDRYRKTGGKAKMVMGWPSDVVDDNRWTKKTTEWRPRTTKRNPGRPRTK